VVWHDPGQGLAVVPFMFLLMSGAMRGMDPALEEASLVAGGGWLRTLTRVTIPVLRPTMLSVLLLTPLLLWSHSISRCSSAWRLAPEY